MGVFGWQWVLDWSAGRDGGLLGSLEVCNNALTTLLDLGGDGSGREGSHVGWQRLRHALRQDWGGLVGALDGERKPGPSGVEKDSVG